MKWEGFKIKELAKNNKLSLQNLADEAGVSRQTVNDWIRGQIPKGNHLLLLCRLLGTVPNAFFSDDPECDISVPIHRQRMHAKISESTQAAAREFAKEYLSIFKNSKGPDILLVIRTQDGKGPDDAKKIAEKLRALSGISEEKPFDYQHTFKLAEALGIHVIFRVFPGSIKSYAFYIRIHGHRVVFVNNSTNIIDLIFPLLHESVHAIRDEVSRDGDFDESEEAFCDLVAGFVQFPPSYVELVYDAIKKLEKPQQINTLKSFAAKHGHSLYGIVRAIKVAGHNFELQVGGADANLRKRFPVIGKIISAGDDVRKYLQVMHVLSKNFVDLLSEQIESISNRKLAEILGIDSELDAQEIRAEMVRELSPRQN